MDSSRQPSPAPEAPGAPGAPPPAGTAPPGAATVTEIEVRVLGPVGVVGAAHPFRRPWALELVVYLAFHRDGVTSDTWAAALWPDRLLADPTRHSTASAARRALGRSAGGYDHLPRAHGVLRLCQTVGTDWDRFERLANEPDPASWSAALSLVRGRPFDGLRSPDWTVLEGVVARVEDGVVQTALRLAGHCLEAGDGHAAELALRRALLASPYDERLYRRLLEAADRQGNPAGVESAMAELVRLVGGDVPAGMAPNRAAERSDLADPDPTIWVHPETAAVYRSLTRRRCRVVTTAGRG